MTTEAQEGWPRFTYHLDREGCDDIFLITDNLTGKTLAGRRFWNDPHTNKAAEVGNEVEAIVDWLNGHCEEWMDGYPDEPEQQPLPIGDEIRF